MRCWKNWTSTRSRRTASFQIDLTWRTDDAGFDIVEVPITFTERAIGESKMNGSIVREAVIRVGSWGVKRRWQQLRR